MDTSTCFLSTEEISDKSYHKAGLWCRIRRLGMSWIIWIAHCDHILKLDYGVEGVDKYISKLLFVYINYLYSASYDMVDSLFMQRFMGCL